MKKLPNKKEITPLVKRLSGIVNSTKTPDLKLAYKEHIANKYAK